MTAPTNWLSDDEQTALDAAIRAVEDVVAHHRLQVTALILTHLDTARHAIHAIEREFGGGR